MQVSMAADTLKVCIPPEEYHGRDAGDERDRKKRRGTSDRRSGGDTCGLTRLF
jgi:hypothetical protein